MRVRGLGDSINYAGGNPCFSEVTGQTIPGCIQPPPLQTGQNPPATNAPCVPPGCISEAQPAISIPSWVWWVAGGIALVLFAGMETR